MQMRLWMTDIQKGLQLLGEHVWLMLLGRKKLVRIAERIFRAFLLMVLRSGGLTEIHFLQQKHPRQNQPILLDQLLLLDQLHRQVQGINLFWKKA
jgi:hypothetical protein